MAPAPLQPADPRVLSEFRLAGRLGEGGQGIVYLGYGPGDDAVAVKILKADADAKVRERLARELAACERVAPFCTARVIDSGVVGARPYIVSEYVDGPSLQERVAERGPLREGELDRLVVGTATALTAIHGAGVLHRDLKPANVLLGPDGPRVVDFGIARPLDAGTITSQLIGTPAYLAPEQLGGQTPSQGADVFAWASTIVFAATGRPPFGNDTIPAVLNRISHAPPDLTGVPRRFQQLLGTCLSKDPRERPTARELLMRLVDPTAGTDAIGHTGTFVDHAASQVLDGIPPGDGPAHHAAGIPSAPLSPGPRTLAWSQTTVPSEQTPKAAPPGRRQGYVLAAVGIGAIALILLGFTGFRYLIGDGGDSPSTPPTGNAPAGARGPAGAGQGIPQRFAGAWSGRVSQDNPGVGSDTFVVQITLGAGERTGRLEIRDVPCAGNLKLRDAGDTELTFHVTFSDSCVAGTVTLSMRDGDLRYRWVADGSDTSAPSSSEGTLRRSS